VLVVPARGGTLRPSVDADFGLDCARTTPRRRRNPTKPDTGAALVPDLIGRDFTTPVPGLKLIGDGFRKFRPHPSAKDYSPHQSG
jgi:hypothetical protein